MNLPKSVGSFDTGRMKAWMEAHLAAQGVGDVPDRFQELMFAFACLHGRLPIIIWDPEYVESVEAQVSRAVRLSPATCAAALNAGLRSRSIDAEASYQIPDAGLTPPQNVDAFAETGQSWATPVILEILLSFTQNSPLSDLVFDPSWTIPSVGAPALTEGLPNVYQQPNYSFAAGRFRLKWRRDKEVGGANLNSGAQRQTAIYLTIHHTPRGQLTPAPCFVSEAGAAAPVPLRTTLISGPSAVNVQCRGLTTQSDFVQSVLSALSGLQTP